MPRCFFDIQDCKICVGAGKLDRLAFSTNTTLKLSTGDKIRLARLKRKSHALRSMKEQLAGKTGNFTLTDEIIISRLSRRQAVHSLEEYCEEPYNLSQNPVELLCLPNELLANIALNIPPESQTSFRLICKRIDEVFIQAKRANLYSRFSQEYALEFQLLTADVGGMETPLDPRKHCTVMGRLEARMRDESGYRCLKTPSSTLTSVKHEINAHRFVVNGANRLDFTPRISEEFGPRFRRHAYWFFSRFQMLKAQDLQLIELRFEKSKEVSDRLRYANEKKITETDLRRVPTLQLLVQFRAIMSNQSKVLTYSLRKCPTEAGNRLLLSIDDLYLSLLVHYRVTEASSKLTDSMNGTRFYEEAELRTSSKAFLMKTRMAKLFLGLCTRARQAYSNLMEAMTPVIQKRLKLPKWSILNTHHFNLFDITEAHYTSLLDTYTSYLLISLPFHKILDYADPTRQKQAVNKQVYKEGSSWATWTRWEFEANEESYGATSLLKVERCKHDAKNLDEQPASAFESFLYSMLFESGDEEARPRAWRNAVEVVKACRIVLGKADPVRRISCTCGCGM
jgi:hypothetical protein